MSASDPAGEKIVRNLQEAVEALQRDVTRVELWAGALGSFTKPIPEYGHGQTRFDLPTETDENSQTETDENSQAPARSDASADQGGAVRCAGGTTFDAGMRGAAGRPSRRR